MSSTRSATNILQLKICTAYISSIYKWKGVTN
uniref:Uncharacterized protein n=1 Tax=Anguilla anguilla TaxID=7936 RepID=A0A0E9VLI8_ANGAN